MSDGLSQGHTSEERFDQIMRIFLYVLTLMLPYSTAVIEWGFGLALVTFIAKRIYLFKCGDRTRLWEIFRPKENPLNRPIAVYLFVCLISVFRSDQFADSFESLFTKTAEPIILYFLFLEAFRNEKQLRVLLMVLLSTAVVTCIDAVVQFHITGQDFFLGRPLSKGPRATAGFNAPNGLGAYLIMSLPVLTGFLYTGPWKGMRRRFTIPLLWGILGYTLILTFSRGAWLSLVLGCIVTGAIIMLKQKCGSRQILAFLLGSVLLLALISSYYVSHKDRFSSLNRSVLNWRLEIWSDTVGMVRERPWFGYGLNTYMRKFQSYRYDRRLIPKYKRKNATYAHNCYLQIAMESGLVGFAAFMWIVISYYQFVIRKLGDIVWRSGASLAMVVGCFTGVTAFKIHAFFDTHFYSLPLVAYLWTVLAVTVVLLNSQENGKEVYV